MAIPALRIVAMVPLRGSYETYDSWHGVDYSNKNLAHLPKQVTMWVWRVRRADRILPPFSA